MRGPALPASAAAVVMSCAAAEVSAAAKAAGLAVEYQPVISGGMTAQDVADQYLAILLDGIAPRTKE